MRRILLVATVALLSVFTCSSAIAGGPKKISKCTTIKKSGSYVVTKNLKASTKTDGNCIIIEANFVTIDLNGFTLMGLGDTTGRGVWDNGISYQGVVIRNGVITEFTDGIRLSSENCTIEKIMAVNNTYPSSVRGYGIAVGPGSKVTGCIAHGNSYRDIHVYCPSKMVDNIMDNWGTTTIGGASDCYRGDNIDAH